MAVALPSGPEMKLAKLLKTAADAVLDTSATVVVAIAHYSMTAAAAIAHYVATAAAAIASFAVTAAAAIADFSTPILLALPRAGAKFAKVMILLALDIHDFIVGGGPGFCFAAGLAAGLLLSPKLRGALAQYKTAEDVPAGLFRSKTTLRGIIVKVSDGDTMRIRHRPRVWKPDAWLKGKMRGQQKGMGKLSEETIAVRICAVDCPETAKFGSSGQAFGDTATDFVRDKLEGKSVGFKLLARDQYQRAVCAVTYGKGPLGLLREDLSLELLRKGLATVYKSAGAEYNGRTLEALDTMESDARKKGMGMWSEGWPSVIVESPAEYKRRMALEKAKAE